MSSTVENGYSPATQKNKPVPLLFSCRLTLFIVCMLATLNFLLQRLNINFALVCMVRRNVGPTSGEVLLNSDNYTSILNESLEHLDIFNKNSTFDESFVTSDYINDPDAECKLVAATSASNSSSFYDQGEFNWTKDVQGALLASFYYGFVFTQIPGGWICDRFGAKKAFLWSGLVFSFLSLLNPIAARYGPEYLFAIRLIQGLSNGASIPSINVLSARWCAATERAFLLGIAYAGFSIASAITYPIAAILCEYLGWPSIFYGAGLTGIGWCVMAYFLVFDWPETHPRIQPSELMYLKKHRAVQYGEAHNKKLTVPWMRMIFSRPIIALIITNFCCFWGFLTIVTYLPTFLKEVLYMDISKNGLYSSFPFVLMLVAHFMVSKLFDHTRRKGFCKLTTLRKIFNTLGMFVPAICMIVVGFVSCSNPLGAVFIIGIGQAFTEFAFMGGYLFSVFELAPRYAGIVTGVSNTFGLLTGFLCPAFVSYLTPTGSREEWLMVFYVAAGFNIFGGIVYILFGSCELQPWASAASPSAETEMKSLQENLLKSQTKNVNTLLVK